MGNQPSSSGYSASTVQILNQIRQQSQQSTNQNININRKKKFINKNKELLEEIDSNFLEKNNFCPKCGCYIYFIGVKCLFINDIDDFLGNITIYDIHEINLIKEYEIFVNKNTHKCEEILKNRISRIEGTIKTFLIEQNELSKNDKFNLDQIINIRNHSIDILKKIENEKKNKVNKFDELEKRVSNLEYKPGGPECMKLLNEEFTEGTFSEIK